MRNTSIRGDNLELLYGNFEIHRRGLRIMGVEYSLIVFFAGCEGEVDTLIWNLRGYPAVGLYCEINAEISGAFNKNCDVFPAMACSYVISPGIVLS